MCGSRSSFQVMWVVRMWKHVLQVWNSNSQSARADEDVHTDLELVWLTWEEIVYTMTSCEDLTFEQMPRGPALAPPGTPAQLC